MTIIEIIIEIIFFYISYRLVAWLFSHDQKNLEFMLQKIEFKKQEEKKHQNDTKCKREINTGIYEEFKKLSQHYEKEKYDELIEADKKRVQLEQVEKDKLMKEQLKFEKFKEFMCLYEQQKEHELLLYNEQEAKKQEEAENEEAIRLLVDQHMIDEHERLTKLVTERAIKKKQEMDAHFLVERK